MSISVEEARKLAAQFNQVETPRVIRAAAILAERYMNPDVAAFNRMYRAEGKSKRRSYFWFRVGRALGAAYVRRSCPTIYEREIRRQIEAVRATFQKAEGVLA